MEIQLMYTLKRNLSLIIKRNPQKFPDVKLNKTLQEGLVDEEWDKIEEIIERRGANLRIIMKNDHL
jgi:molybdenum cofactor biosynthesis enzyme MoaA